MLNRIMDTFRIITLSLLASIETCNVQKVWIMHRQTPRSVNKIFCLHFLSDPQNMNVIMLNSFRNKSWFLTCILASSVGLIVLKCILSQAGGAPVIQLWFSDI